MFNRISNGLVISNAKADIIKVLTMLIIVPFRMARAVPASSFAPKNWETTIPEPMALPKQREVNTIETEPVAPTEAKAFAPIKCPTIILSTMINDCCKIVPNISGMAKDKSNFVGLPVVIFVCLLIFF